ncbi:hypothetical protein [uncultured Ruminococcus sp.]|uniref:hypothetical protein n=1 Tax=uncultured Ruminococcus sp. TaxID=165186 RepID=UPI002666128C|nr:hypothetical protein [uncultured Ruminococcus sp.]
MRKYEAVCSFDVLDAVANGERILLIDRTTESINSLDEISTKDLAIAIKDENKDNRYEFYKEVKVNERNIIQGKIRKRIEVRLFEY